LGEKRRDVEKNNTGGGEETWLEKEGDMRLRGLQGRENKKKGGRGASRRGSCSIRKGAANGRGEKERDKKGGRVAPARAEEKKGNLPEKGEGRSLGKRKRGTRTEVSRGKKKAFGKKGNPPTEEGKRNSMRGLFHVRRQRARVSCEEKGSKSEGA